MSKRLGIKSSSKPSSGVMAGIDGFAATLGKPNEMDKGCSLCGAVGHKASAHSTGKAVLGDNEDDGKGEGKEVDRETQRDFNTSQYTTGSPNYKPPGEQRGKGQTFS